MGNSSTKQTGLEQVIRNQNLKEGDKDRLRNNVNTPLPTGDTLLLAAVQDGHADTVRVLLEAGANVNLCDRHGDSPLSTAVRCGSEEITETLLNHKDINVSIRDKYGMTPLHVACVRRKPVLVKMLLDYGAESWPLQLDSSKSQPSPPIMLCLEVSDLASMAILLDAGASPNCLDQKGDTPLIKAIYKKQLDFVCLLLKYKPNLRIKNNYGNSALQYALQLNLCGVVKILVEKGLDYNGHDPCDFRLKARERALFLAIRTNCKSCYQELLDAGEDIFLETNEISPLLSALDCRRSFTNSQGLHTLNYEPPFIISSDRLSSTVRDLAHQGADFGLVWNRAVWVTTTVDVLAGSELAHVFCIRCYGFGGHLPVVQQQTAYFRALALNAADEALSLLCFAYYTPSAEDVTVVQTRRNRRRFGAHVYQPAQERNADTEKMARALEAFRTNPRSLQNLSVITIRKTISDNVLYKAPKLGLPSRLTDLVTFENAPGFSTEIRLVT